MMHVSMPLSIVSYHVCRLHVLVLRFPAPVFEPRELGVVLHYLVTNDIAPIVACALYLNTTVTKLCFI